MKKKKKKKKEKKKKKRNRRTTKKMTTVNGNNARASASSPSSTSSSSSSGDDSERELGRHDYWESTYERELATLQETGDEGEVWFGGKVEEAVAAFCAELLLPPPSPPPPPPFPPPPSSAALGPRLIDVGCGNGALLLALAARGFRDLTGSDYSERALALARAVVEKRKEKVVKRERGGEGGVSALSRASFSFVLDDATRSTLAPGTFDAATDKGTLDAVGLSAGGAAARRAYLLGVARCLRKEGGLLILTSVNSTLKELRAEVEALREEGEREGEEEKEEQREAEGAAAAMAGDDEEKATEKKDKGSSPSSSPSTPPLFDYLDHVKTYPVYSFGGRTGARVATVAFRKR